MPQIFYDAFAVFFGIGLGCIAVAIIGFVAWFICYTGVQLTDDWLDARKRRAR